MSNEQSMDTGPLRFIVLGALILQNTIAERPCIITCSVEDNARRIGAGPPQRTANPKVWMAATGNEQGS